MDKMKMETVSLTERNIDKVAEMFPNVVTEVKDSDGTVRRAIDFDALKAELSADAVEGRECYEFTWAGKTDAKIEASKSIRKTLRPCKEESKNWDATQNLYIEGDNLDVLKLLQESYLGKVKMIYIDPPYNTGKDSLLYRDKKIIEEDEYNRMQGYIDDDDRKVFIENVLTNPRFHSEWCSGIYSILKLSRNILSDDGAIFISINELEVANLKKIADEIFGADNFIDIFCWQKTATPPNLSNFTKKSYEYILSYKKKDLLHLKGLVKESKSSNGLMNQPNSIHTLIFPPFITKTKLSDGIYKKGNYGTSSYDIILNEDTEVKNGVFVKPVSLSGKFKWSQEYLNEAIKNGVSIFIQTSAFSPSYIKEEYDAEAPWNVIDSRFGVGTNENAGNEVDSLFSKNFSETLYPKPVSLIKYLIKMLCSGNDNDNDNDIVMDFYSGSATTAHAVMQLNAEDGGNRKFIMVQIPEKCDEKSEAFKAGYKNICEIGKERIRRAGEKIVAETGKTDLDIGFRVLKLASTNMKDVYYTPAELTQKLLANTENNIKDDRTDMDLLYGCLLDWGVELSLPHETKQIGGCSVHFVNRTDLIACFDANVPETVVRAIAAEKPVRVVFRDSSFKNISDKNNVTEIFKAVSPDTTVKVI